MHSLNHKPNQPTTITQSQICRPMQAPNKQPEPPTLPVTTRHHRPHHNALTTPSNYTSQRAQSHQRFQIPQPTRQQQRNQSQTKSHPPITSPKTNPQSTQERITINHTTAQDKNTTMRHRPSRQNLHSARHKVQVSTHKYTSK